MNEHQLLCFLTVSRTLNFSAAARELYCTQPALSYQIRSLEKELDAALFRRTTTQVALTEAGRALLPHAEDIYRGILNARTALKGFGTHHTLTLRLPPVLLQRDPIYPILMARLHAALPGYEFKVDTTPVPSSYHHMLCTEADAALYLPFGPLPPEIRCETIISNRFYLIIDNLMSELLEKNPAPDKMADGMAWTRHMNQIKAQAEELCCLFQHQFCC